MRMTKRRFGGGKLCSLRIFRKRNHEEEEAATTAAVAIVALTVGGAPGMWAQDLATKTSREKQTIRFYCNIKALNPTERAHHKQLTDKLT
jgi:hypothetical protein